jgi:perosamine synthetase
LNPTNIEKYIPVNVPTIYGDELLFVEETIKSNWISSESPSVDKFEAEMAKLTGRNYGVAVSNGTAALEIIIRALGIGPGDEVILPTFTIISCAQAVTKAGATPVLVDSGNFTWNMDVEQIESKINSSTKAIMMVHIYGLPVDVDKVLQIAEKYNLYVIEDAAEAIGLSYKGKKCGGFGHVSAMSFFANKHITTGEGGMILTNDKKIALESRYFSNLCFNSERRFKHTELGWNYRISGLQAAFGLGQIRHIEETILRKIHIGLLYDSLLPEDIRFQKPLTGTSYSENVFWVYGILMNPKFGITAQQIMEKLDKRGIGTRPFFYPMHQQPVFQKMGLFENTSYPVAEILGEFGFYLPSGTGTANEDVLRVVSTFLAIIEELNV